MNSLPSSTTHSDKPSKVSSQGARHLLNRPGLLTIADILVPAAWDGQAPIFVLTTLFSSSAGLAKLWTHLSLARVSRRRERKVFPGEKSSVAAVISRGLALSGNRPEEIKAAEATAKRLQNEEDLARLDVERNQASLSHKTISQGSLDRARTIYESARQSRENALQNLILLKLGSRKEDIAAAKAAVELARSRVTEAAPADTLPLSAWRDAARVVKNYLLPYAPKNATGTVFARRTAKQ